MPAVMWTKIFGIYKEYQANIDRILTEEGRNQAFDTMQRQRQGLAVSRSPSFRPPLLQGSTNNKTSPKPLQRTKVTLSNKRELMNCIAYSPGNQRDADARWLDLWDDDSLSSDTTSDITDVSPASSMSDFAGPSTAVAPSSPSASLQASSENLAKKAPSASVAVISPKIKTPKSSIDLHTENGTKFSKLTETKSPKSPVHFVKMKQSLEDCHSDHCAIKSPVRSNSETTISEMVSLVPRPISATSSSNELQLLVAALSELESSSDNSQRSCNGTSASRASSRSCLNLSFTPDKARQIARENANLLGRLQRARLRGPQLVPLPGPPESSAAINRRQKQRQIQHDNMILLRKITSARATMGVRSRGSSVSAARPSTH